jgi:hypothetical protein
MRIWLALSALSVSLAFQSSSSEPKILPATQDVSNTAGQTQATAGACRTRDHLSPEDFTSVMHTIQDAWSAGNARTAADCFTENAIYSSPPAHGHQGRENLYQHFGGAKGLAMPMKVEWHHLIFDSTQQVGMAEFTYRYHLQTNGVVVLKFSNGLISNWREYDVPSDLIWSKFVGPNDF